MNKLLLLEQLSLTARQNNDEIAKNLYSTLKGDVVLESKRSGVDTEIILESIAKKFTKNARLINDKNSEYEIKLLEVFMPTLMSESDIISELKRIITPDVTNFGAKMGIAMKALKGKADGNLVKQILSEHFK